MNPASDPYDGGLGGPGIWDQMPLVPPTTIPQEIDDSELIWSKPKTATTKKTARKKTKTKKTKTKKTKTAGRSKKRR
jgi:hypothetical protein